MVSPHHLTFLKLGGSLITDKTQPSTPLPDAIQRLAAEIAAALQQNPSMRLVLGHGSGSFGHVAAKEHGTRQGVHSPQEWRGFAQVWFQASALHRIVIESLHQVGLPAVSFPPSAAALTEDGLVKHWDLTPLKTALDQGLLPVVYGDVVFDTARGGTILSTEDIFSHLAPRLKPRRILLAGIEPGVWADYPACTEVLPAITPKNIQAVSSALRGSAATDVTGGMESKVQEMLSLVQAVDGLEVCVFSGAEENLVLNALNGKSIGTRIAAHDG